MQRRQRYAVLSALQKDTASAPELVPTAAGRMRPCKAEQNRPCAAPADQLGTAYRGAMQAATVPGYDGMMSIAHPALPPSPPISRAGQSHSALARPRAQQNRHLLGLCSKQRRLQQARGQARPKTLLLLTGSVAARHASRMDRTGACRMHKACMVLSWPRLNRARTPSSLHAPGSRPQRRVGCSPRAVLGDQSMTKPGGGRASSDLSAG